ncbi:larval cuticle protein 65Ag1 isoform X2 [Drosophila mojavensis]|nr:larval cuticle protein 65Ag1 isoform X2 [Drosophila mojavensis]
MKFLIAFVALFAVVAHLNAAPLSAQQQADVQILRLDSDVGPENFNYAFETSDGTAAQAQGQLNNVGTENEAISVKGSYSFVGDDGVQYTVQYIADENGFQPQGAHLPVA